MALEQLRRWARTLAKGGSRPTSAWRTPVLLDRGALGEATLALDGHGHGAALWENGGKLWTLPVGPHLAPAMARLPLGEGRAPCLVMNQEGRGIALWRSEQAGEQQLLGRVLGGAESPSQVLFRTPGRIHHLQAAVDRRGNVLAVWLHEGLDQPEILAQSFDLRQAGWDQTPTRLGYAASPDVVPRLAANQREHAMVVWEAEQAGSHGLVASHFWPKDRIWSDRPVSVVAHATRQLHVGMDDLGHALALWVHAPYGQRPSLEASRYDGLCCEWEAAEVLATAEVLTVPQLGMAGDGEALATWCQAEGHGASRLITKGFRQGRWEPGVECLELGHEPVREVALDVLPGGRAALVAVHHGAQGDWVSARLRTGHWSDAAPLATTPHQGCALPLVRLCPQGASALWVQSGSRERALVLAETW